MYCNNGTLYNESICFNYAGLTIFEVGRANFGYFFTIDLNITILKIAQTRKNIKILCQVHADTLSAIKFNKY